MCGDRLPLRLCALAIMLLLGAAPDAGAQTEEARAAAAPIVQQGLAFARAGQYDKAVERFEEALKLFPHPEILHNLARSHEELGHLVEAHAYFSRALELEAGYTYAAEARQRVNRIERALRETHGRVRITSTPNRVELTLRPARGGPLRHLATPLERWVPAGKLIIVGQKASFMDQEMEEVVKAGKDLRVEIVLRPVQRKGFLEVTAPAPRARVLLNGKEIGEAPIRGLPVDSGSYALRVEARGYHAFEEQVVIEPDRQTTVLARLERIASAAPIGPTGPAPGPAGGSSNAMTVAGGVLLGVGVAVAGAAVGLNVHAYNLAKKAADSPDQCAAYDPVTKACIQNIWDDGDQAEKDAFTFAYAAYGLYAAGGVLAATGLVLVLVDQLAGDDSDVRSARALQVTPAIAPSRHGLLVGATLEF